MHRMSRYRELLTQILRNDSLKTISNYFTGEASVKAIGVITIPVLTRILSPSEYGYLSIINSLISIFIIILPLNQQVSLRPRYLKEEKNFDEYLGTVLISAIIIGLFFSILLKGFSQKIAVFFNIPVILFQLSILAAFIRIIKEIYFRTLLAFNNSKKYAITNFLFYSGDAIATICFAYFLLNEKYLGKAYAQIIVGLLFLIYSFYRLNSYTAWKFKAVHLKASLLFSMPLIFHAISHYVLAQFDRIIINQVIGTTETGFYSLAYSVGSLLMITITAVNNSWIPYFFKKIKASQHAEIENGVGKYYNLVLISGLIIALFGKELISIFAPPEYTEAYLLIPVIVISNVFVYLYMIYANYAFYNGRTYMISVNTLIAGSLNILLNYLLVPKYGYSVAAVTTLISYVVLFVLHYLNARIILKYVTIRIYKLLLRLIFAVAYYILVFYISDIPDMLIITSLIKSVFILFFVFIVFRKRIKNILQ